MTSIQQQRAFSLNGFIALLVWLALAGLCASTIVDIAQTQQVAKVWQPIVLGLVLLLSLGGFFVNQPNESRVLVFFGRYVGTVAGAGYHFANPFAAKHPVSLRVHNFNSEKLKVNDARGNPIEIAAVIVWRVTDSAKALLEVENYRGFVAIQSETAIRAVATRFPYDSHDGEVALRSHQDEINAGLQQEVQARLDVAGLEVVDCRLSHLAYAPEIAQAMLRRQQAEAVVAARRQIVEGAVSMVEMGLRRLEEHGIVRLDEERKASMVNNLLVALVADREAQPVINTGNIYS
ncbi:SPFH domain / Band 7 family protein [Nannocystis exedens]|uniref:SPFH domain / Band 7 family protein n=1 Tax=Nannocystis exedens TaxID=54 RepID=A0A1I1ZND3_9BACT|nr:SPFH domain-containing protein [Nannocystis exedens]PCC75403.1 membrane protein [Nannocystis exedens]SFE33199.1 SPFH domain / Band 7 family protein [Nannocystis exedens]